MSSQKWLTRHWRLLRWSHRAWKAPSGLLDALTEEAPAAENADASDDDLLAALTDDGPSTATSTFMVDLGNSARSVPVRTV